MGKSERERSARERIKEQQLADRAKEKRRRTLTYVAVGALALVAIGGGWFYSYSTSQAEETSAGNLAPITAAADGTFVMAKAGVTKPVLDVYEDFQCPACKEFEAISGATIKNLAYEGKAKVVYHPISIFSEEPTKGNSLRAGAAVRCVPGGNEWMKYHDKLFEEQPSETVEGFKLPDLVSWGEEVGVKAPGFEQCVTGQQKAQAQIDFSEKTMTSAGIKGTPTLKLDGKVLEGQQLGPEGLREAVLDAAK